MRAADLPAGSIGGPMLTVMVPGETGEDALAPELARIVRHRDDQAAGAQREMGARPACSVPSGRARRACFPEDHHQ